MFSLSGLISFGAAKTISQRMGIITKYDVLILDFSDVPLLGVTASLASENIIKDAHSKNRQICLVGATGKVQEKLQKMKLLKLMPAEHRFSERLPAFEEAIAHIESSNIGFQNTN